MIAVPLVLALAVAAPRPLLADSYDRDAPPELEVLRAPSGHLLVATSVNGSDPAWFLFDTGADQHVIALDLAVALDLKPHGETLIQGTVGRSTAGTWRAASLAVGPVKLHRPVLAGLDLADLSARLGVEVSGIVGDGLLVHCVAAFDYRRGTIVLHDPEGFTEPDAGWQPLEGPGDRALVRAGFEGRDEVFVLDTGAIGAVTFTSPTVQRLDLLEGRETTTERSAGVIGVAEYERGVLDWFELGGHRIRRHTALFATRRRGGDAVAFPAGRIGLPSLLPFTVLFDFPRGRVGFVLRQPVTLLPEQLDRFVGVYRIGPGDLRVVSRRGGGLVSRRNDGPRVRMQPSSEFGFDYDRLLASAEFVVSADGRVVEMVMLRGAAPPEVAPRVEIE